MAAHKDPEKALNELNKKLKMRDRGWVAMILSWLISYIVELLIYLQVLPREAMLVSYIVLFVLGIFGAYTLAESKGYVGRYGAWYLLLGFPFLIWFLLAKDRWMVSIQSGSSPIQGETG